MDTDHNHNTRSADNCPRCSKLLRELQAEANAILGVVNELDRWPRRKEIRKGVAP